MELFSHWVPYDTMGRGKHARVGYGTGWRRHRAHHCVWGKRNWGRTEGDVRGWDVRGYNVRVPRGRDVGMVDVLLRMEM